MGCIEYYHKSFEDNVDKSAAATSYQVGWIDYTLQNILGQKFWQQNKQKQQQHIIAPVYITGGEVEMLSGNCFEWSTDRAYIPYPTVTIVKWCHTVMQTVCQHPEGGHWAST